MIHNYRTEILSQKIFYNRHFGGTAKVGFLGVLTPPLNQILIFENLIQLSLGKIAYF